MPSQVLEVEVSFTIEATDELAKAGRRWHYWPGFIAQNLYGGAIVAVLFFGGLSSVVKNFSGPAPNLSRAGLGLLMAIAPVLLFWWIRRRIVRKTAAALASVNPLKLSFTSEGLLTPDRSGATGFTP